MGLRSLFREERIVQDAAWGNWAKGDDILISGNTAAGISVDRDKALQSLTVYGCTDLISSTASTLPVQCYRKLGAEREPVDKPAWMVQPNPEADWTTFVVQVVLSWLLGGDAFVAVRRNGGVVVEATVLDPGAIDVRRDAPGAPRTYWINGQRYRGELIHIPAMMLPQALRGLNPITAAREGIGAELAQRDFGARFFGQGAHLSGVIEVPGDLDDVQAEQIRRGWTRRHSGTRKAHMPGVLTGGAKWSPISISPEDAQFLETRRFTGAEISALLFAIDPAMLGLAQSGTSVTYANLEQRQIHFVQFTMLRWIVRLETLAGLLMQPGEFAKVNVDALLRADTATRYAAHAIAIDKQFMTRNEVRALEDLPPVPGGDEFPTTAPPVAPIGVLP